MKKVIIIGGGIAGTSCAEHLLSHSTDIQVTLIAATDVVKTAVIGKNITQLCKPVDMREMKQAEYQKEFSNINIVVGFVTLINSDAKYCQLKNEKRYYYDKLCIATGAVPNPIDNSSPHVMTLRDTDTANELMAKIKEAKKVVVVGNGGIALELVYEIENCKVVWCVKDDFIGSTFLDKGAATFLLNSLDKQDKIDDRKSDQLVFKRKRYHAERELFGKSGNQVAGSALGPDWCSAYQITGSNSLPTPRNVQIEYSCEVNSIKDNKSDDNYNVDVELNNGKSINGDVIISATGVRANRSFEVVSTKTLECNDENYICVNDNMETNLQDIYAAGDICHASWSKAKNWFQMKLWTQAYQFGAYAGKCIIDDFQNERSLLDFCFELFTHTTTFFGYKVILLGNYNFQNLEKNDCKVLLRCTPNLEYVKLVLMDGRVQGAVLIGETDLEETIENLIVNETDVDFLGESLLDPQIDIEDYFD